MRIFKIIDRIFRPKSLWNSIEIKELHNLWLNPAGFKAPRFPIIHDSHFDSSVSDLSRCYLIKDNVEMVFDDPDYHGYAWDESERFIDSDGFIFSGTYKDMNHPFGWVHPIDSGERITLEELKSLLLRGKRYHEVKDIAKPLDQINSIEELILCLN